MKLLLSIIISSVLILLVSCRSTKLVPDDSFLLAKRHINIDNKNIDKEELTSYVKQKTNRKLFGLWRFHLGAYNLAGTKESKFRNGLRTTIGEAPVLYDSLLTLQSKRQLKLYLNNKGYFLNTIIDTVIYKKKKAFLTYSIHAGNPYIIKNFSYQLEDKKLASFVFSDTLESLIKKGDIYDAELLQLERDRITNTLRDNGYFDFIKESISFTADTIGINHGIDITLTVKNNQTSVKLYADSVQYVPHKKYQIREVYIYPDFITQNTDSTQYDTVVFNTRVKKGRAFASPYLFVTKGKTAIDPSTIVQSIFIKKNDLYSITDVQRSYKLLSELTVFKYINITFEKVSQISTFAVSTRIDTLYPIICKIYLSRLPKQSISFETEGTNSGGDLGIAANIMYQNRNFFRAAEIFEIKLKGAMEVQNIEVSGTSNQVIIDKLPFNTLETGIVTTIRIPRFVVPVRETRFPKYFKPRTNISGGLNFQKRPDYTRYMSNFVFGYEWKESRFKKHIFNPIDFSGVSINRDSIFTNKINKLNDKRIRSAYSDHLTPAMSYSFILNNQKLNKQSNFSYLRINAEVAGNLLWIIQNKNPNAELNDEGGYNIYGIKFAQYVRLDAEYRYYKIFNERNRIVFRSRFGTGYPFNNATTLPFEKAFFSGGANSVRGWQLRSLGPGSYNDDAGIQFDKTGEIILESNIEYRFPIYKVFNGGFFIDAGNIWLRHPAKNYPGGDFQLNRFYKEIAIDYGLGLRLDFNYFIIRLDMALPAYYPSKTEGERWQIRYTKIKNINYNLGIGYPF